MTQSSRLKKKRRSAAPAGQSRLGLALRSSIEPLERRVLLSISANLTANNVSTPNGTESVVAEYTSTTTIQTSTIASANLMLTGPGPGPGPSEATIGSNITIDASNPDDVFATYTVIPPSGTTWNTGDDGSYTVSLQPNQVEDSDGNFAAPTSTGFNITADSTPPVANSVSAPNITSASGDTDTVTVVYSDNVAVSAGTINTSNISISGGPTAIDVTGVTSSPPGDGSPITATYTIAKANAQTWAFPTTAVTRSRSAAIP